MTFAAKLPNTIFEDLFLGAHYSTSQEILQASNIKYVLNVSDVLLDNTNIQNLKQIQLCDIPTENSIDLLDALFEAFDFISKFFVTYRMKYKGYTLKESYEYVKKCRPIISPHKKYWKQLMIFEKQLYSKNSVTKDTLEPLSLILQRLNIIPTKKDNKIQEESKSTKKVNNKRITKEEKKTKRCSSELKTTKIELKSTVAIS